MFREQISNFWMQLSLRMTAAWSTAPRGATETASAILDEDSGPRQRREVGGAIRSVEERETQRVIRSISVARERSHSKGEQP